MVKHFVVGQQRLVKEELLNKDSKLTIDQVTNIVGTHASL